METRSFRTGDVQGLMDLWRRSITHDPIAPDRFRDLVLLDANFDPEGLRLAVEDGRIVGAAYAVRRLHAMTGADLEPQQGWLLFFCTDPRVRRRGIARLLLDEALEWLRAQGRTRVDFSSYTPNYLLPGLDTAAYPEAAALLAGLGFRTLYEAAAMDRGLTGYTLPPAVAERAEELTAAGYAFGTPALDDLPDLVRLAGEHFNPDWARAIREAVQKGMPLDRIVIVRDPDGRLLGWAMHEAYEGMTERFGPFGVLEAARGTGLGTVLLHLTLERMRARGAHGAWFLWTGEQTAAGRLYLRTDFATTRRFQVMRWEA